MHERIAERICTATGEVFSTMLALEIVPGEAYVETAAAPSSEGVVALIGLAGERVGVLLTGMGSDAHRACSPCVSAAPPWPRMKAPA